jgi:hypothetical protein
MTRSLDERRYLLGRAGGVLLLTFSVFLVPILLYYLGATIFFRHNPTGWHGDWALGLVYALVWSLLVTGLALGLSAVARSSRGAALILLGGVAGLEIIVSRLLAGLTGNEQLQILSPFAAMDQQGVWLWNLPPPHAFPLWWAVAEIAALLMLGWALVAWRRPRVRGAEA